MFQVAIGALFWLLLNHVYWALETQNGPSSFILFLFDSSHPGQLASLDLNQFGAVRALADDGMVYITEQSSSPDEVYGKNNNFNSQYPYFNKLRTQLEEIGYTTVVKSFYPSTETCGQTADSCHDSELVLSNYTAETFTNDWLDWLVAQEENQFFYIFHLPSDMRLESTEDKKDQELAMNWIVGLVTMALQEMELAQSTLIFANFHDPFTLDQFPEHDKQFANMMHATYKILSPKYSVPGIVTWPEGLSPRVYRQAPLTSQSICKTIYSLAGLEPSSDLTSTRVPDQYLPIMDYEDVEVVENFFTDEECEYFIDNTFPSHAPEHKTKADETNPDRKWIYRVRDSMVQNVSERIESFTEYPVENMEDLQVAYYKTGVGTLPRFEACVSNSEYCNTDRERGGLRALSIFIFLNDEFEGGELEFPARGLLIKGKKGTAVFLNNLDFNEGAHIGGFYRDTPVKEGKKYLGYIFVRQRAFTFPVTPEPPPYVSTANMTELQEVALTSKFGPVVTGTLPCAPVCTTNETDGDYIITYYDNFISQQESDYLIELGKPSLVRSSVMGDDPVIESRTSRNTFVFRTDPVVMSLAERIADVVKMPIENQEAMQIVHYSKRQEYKAHFDACVADHVSCVEDRKRGGLRYVTMFIYLNDEFQGGGTGFPSLNCVSPAKKHRGVVFYNLNKDNSTSHPYSFHSGEPVIEGEKFGANIWIRLNKFD